MKEIYFYEADVEFTRAIRYRDPTLAKPYLSWTWDTTKDQVTRGVTPIFTTQMGLLSLDLIAKGYRIFVKNAGQKQVEICLGENAWTDKELRPAHNIFKMWQAGAIRGESQ